MGQCNRCGACCIAEKCKHLLVKDGIATCLIFDSPNRPDYCKMWPNNPPILFKTCGYYFIDTWENNKKLGVREV